MLDGSLRVNDVGGTEGVSSVQIHGSVGLRDGTVQVSEERDVEGASQTTFLPAGLDPGKMRVDRVDGDTEDLSTNLTELVSVVGELEDLGGAHEGPIQGVEEEDDPLASIVGEGDLLDLAVDDSVGGEGGGSFSDLGHGVLLVWEE